MKVVRIIVPPDKSISHRAVMLASISDGITRVKNLLMGEDCLRTIKAFRAMGVRIKIIRRRSSVTSADVLVHGVGMRGLKRPAGPLYLGNSGTTMRILPGILAGQDFKVVLKGDSSLSQRPMYRIARPLRRMGAAISGRGKAEIYPPLKILGGRLKPIKYRSKIASAQVKTCVLLAGLFAEGLTRLTEPVKSRDHTERMLRQFGCKLKIRGCKVTVRGPVKLKSLRIINIPGDISSAAFFIAAGCVLPGIKIVIEDVGLNPTRTGLLDLLKRMGADVKVSRYRSRVTGAEPIGNVMVKSGKLRGISISPREVVKAIDEIPIIMVTASFAKGITIIKGIGELRVKETDRINSMATNLRKMGADIEIKEDLVRIKGGRPLRGAKVSSFGDHRTAMSMLIAGLGAEGRQIVSGLDCINKSFPGFENLLRKLPATI